MNWRKIKNHWYNLSLATRITDVQKKEGKECDYYSIGIKYAHNNWENINFDTKSQAEMEHALLIQNLIKN